MELKRVVVTGLGAVTPLGNTPEETWNNIIAGVSGAAEITQCDTSKFKTHFACEVKNLNIGDYLATLPNASFRISFTKNDHYQLYDLIIDSGDNTDPVKDIEALHKYLRALAGGDRIKN